MNVDSYISLEKRAGNATAPDQVTLLALSIPASPRLTSFSQGGVLSGLNPVIFAPSDPIRLWIIQIGALSQFLQNAA
jgi:hypothetical protein